MGVVEIKVRIKQDILQLAYAKGYTPEEVGNLVGQKLSALYDLIENLMDGI